jgi:hypothetical protein
MNNPPAPAAKPVFNLRPLLERGYDRFGANLALGVVFFLPLKLAIAYLFLIPLNLLWIFRLLVTRRFTLGHLTAVRALLFFLLLVGLSAIAGLDPMRSLAKMLRFGFYAATIFTFAELRGAHVLRLLGALILGQTIAAVHSVLASAFPSLPALFLGSVSESGQLSISIITALGVGFALNRQGLRAAHRDDSGAAEQRFRQERRHAVLLGTLLFLLLLSVSFGGNVDLRGTSFTVVLLSALCGSLLGIVVSLQITRLKIPHLPRLFFLISFVVPYLVTALLVNLKRGPWLGVFVGGLILLLLHARRFFIPLIVSAIVLAISIPALRNRLAESSEHFFIAGGRQVIWEIGAELSLRYPLGIGYENSRILRKFSPEIPPELIHFHNNPLQILVESGWFALGVYIWWIIAVVRMACTPHRSKSESLVCAAIGCAVVAWQAAGLVEYNLGDSEVALVAFIAIGLMLKLKLPHCPGSSASLERLAPARL